MPEDTYDDEIELAKQEPYEPRHTKWFGEPWPSRGRPAMVCSDERYRVETPVGQPCCECGRQIKENDRGVVTAASPRIFGTYMINDWPHVPFHLACFLQEVVGGEMSVKLMHKIEGHEVLDDYEPPSHVTRQPVAGRGWKHQKAVQEEAPEGGDEQAEADEHTVGSDPEAKGS